MMDWAAKEAELRADNWPEDEIRRFRESYEAEKQRRSTWATASYPTARTGTGPEDRPVTVRRYSAPGNAERVSWERGSVAGALSMLFPEPDQAREMADARTLQDHYEYAYNRRPELAECLAAVRHNGPRGMSLSGTVPEIQQLFRAAGVPTWVTTEMPAPGSQSGGVVSGPRGELVLAGDPALAEQTRAALLDRAAQGRA